MTPTCPLCSSVASLRIRTRDLNWRLSREEFLYYSCPDCGILFLFPIPVDLGRYYSSIYTPYLAPASASENAAAAKRESDKLAIVRRFATDGRLLEIGPGYGGFALVAMNAGFDITVLEMNAACCGFLRESGINTIESADVAAGMNVLGQFDVITLWHVLEHLPDAWKTLDRVISHLAPGGILVISTPNPESFQFRVLGKWWSLLDAPRHLQLVPISALNKWAETSGLRQMLVTTTDVTGIALNQTGWQLTMMNLFSNSFGSFLMRILGRLATIAAMPIDRSGFRGSAYTAVFKAGRPKQNASGRGIGENK